MSTESNIRYRTDFYVPVRNESERLKAWLSNMKDLANSNVRTKLEKRFMESGGSSPFAIFLRTHRIDLEFECELEYIKLCRTYWFEIEKVNSDLEKYKLRLEQDIK